MAEAGEMVLWKTPGVIVSASFANLISLLTSSDFSDCSELSKSSARFDVCPGFSHVFSRLNLALKSS